MASHSHRQVLLLLSCPLGFSSPLLICLVNTYLWLGSWVSLQAMKKAHEWVEEDQSIGSINLTDESEEKTEKEETEEKSENSKEEGKKEERTKTIEVNVDV